jgi:hypothetical protein
LPPTLMVAVRVALPPDPLQVSVYCEVDSNGPVD